MTNWKRAAFIEKRKKESSFQFEETGYKFVINLSLDSEI